MSKNSIPLAAAEAHAREVLQKLQPWCTRLALAGSIRRRKARVGDIEIVCIPQTASVEADLFGTPESVRHPGFIEQVNRWPHIRGKACGKQIVRALPGGVPLDIYTCTPENWGYILALRTGNRQFSMRIVQKLKSLDYRPEDGYVWYRNHKVLIPEEADLFGLLGWCMPAPQQRSQNSRIQRCAPRVAQLQQTRKSA